MFNVSFKSKYYQKRALKEYWSYIFRGEHTPILSRRSPPGRTLTVYHADCLAPCVWVTISFVIVTPLDTWLHTFQMIDRSHHNISCLQYTLLNDVVNKTTASYSSPFSDWARSQASDHQVNNDIYTQIVPSPILRQAWYRTGDESMISTW